MAAKDIKYNTSARHLILTGVNALADAVKVTWYEGRKDGVLVHPPEELVTKVVSAYKAAKAADGFKGVRGDWKNNKEKTAPSGLTLQ